ncbi:hypothetical protein ES707_03200 [subsurface metagenome]
MEPNIITIDPLARWVSFIGLAVAIFVGIVLLLTYLRGRWQNPNIKIHVAQEDPILLLKPQLLVIRFFVDNPSILPNTIIDVSCKSQHNWFKNSPLKIGNIELTFVDVETSKGKPTSDLRLAVAPHTTLDKSDWNVLLEPRGTPLRDGQWKLPLLLSARSPRALVTAITSEYERINEIKKLTITFRDITRKRHSCSLKLIPRI